MTMLNSVLIEGSLATVPLLFELEPQAIPGASDDRSPASSGSQSAPRPFCSFTLTSDDLIITVVVLTRDALRTSKTLYRGSHIRVVGRLGHTSMFPSSSFAELTPSLGVLAEVVEVKRPPHSAPGTVVSVPTSSPPEAANV